MEITTFLYYIPIILALYLISKVNSHLFQNSPKGPPSPGTCLPIIGHLHILKEPLHKTLADLADRYGPILSLKFGSRSVLLISSTEAIEECLSKNDVVFCNRPSGFLMGKQLAFDYTSLVWAPYGAHWRNLRRISTIEIFSSQRLKLLAPIRHDEVNIMIQQLYKICGSSKVGLKPLMYDVAMNVMTRIIFGKRYYGVVDEEGKKFREMFEKLMKKFFNDVCIGDMIPCLRWLNWGKEKKLRKFDVERQVLLRELMKEHKELMKMEEENGDDDECKMVVKPLMQVLLKLQELEPDYYTDEIIFGFILDLLIGSSDTSAQTMEWTLSLLLNHPQILNKARTEIHYHVGYERILEESDLNHLPYLQCIINESLRMYPPLPFLVPHESSEDCAIGGYHIRRGTMLQINSWAIQNDPNIWGDPTIFRPERFEGVEGHKIAGYKMMPFGSGRRSCPGEGLATRLIGLTIGSIIQCFELERIGHELVDMTKADGFIMKKSEPLQAMVRPCLAMKKLRILDQI